MASNMIRMSIDIPKKEHKRLKVLAAAEGVSLRQFVIECIHANIMTKKKPNRATRKAMADTEQGKGLTEHSSIADMLKHLGL